MWLVKPFIKNGIWKSLLWKFLGFVENSKLIPLSEPKKGCFATSFVELHWTLASHCIYMLWVLSNKLQELQKLQLTIYTMQLITIQLQLCHNNSFSTTMQFPYDYNHNVMLTSFFIHPSKFNTWHYEDFLWFKKNIDIRLPLRLFILDGLRLWHLAQSKVVMWHINWILETNIYVYLGRSIHSHR